MQEFFDIGAPSQTEIASSSHSSAFSLRESPGTEPLSEQPTEQSPKALNPKPWDFGRALNLNVNSTPKARSYSKNTTLSDPVSTEPQTSQSTMLKATNPATLYLTRCLYLILRPPGRPCLPLMGAIQKRALNEMIRTLGSLLRQPLTESLKNPS